MELLTGSCCWCAGSCPSSRESMKTRALAPNLPAQGSRGDAEQASDVGGEVAVVGEAHGPGDLGEVEVGVGEQRLRTLHAPVDDVPVRREAGILRERAREVAGAHVRRLRYLRKRQLF